MDIWQADKLLLFIAFVIPGFISLKAYQLIFPTIERSSQSQLIDAIAYSSINYAVLIGPISIIESYGLKELNPKLYWVFNVFVLFIAPILWVLIWSYLRKQKWLRRFTPHPVNSCWDYVFEGQDEYFWIKVTLKNGTQIAGLYADKSFVTNSPAPEQLYLQELWELNDEGGFDAPKTKTRGILILANEISFIELIDV
jgi:hypothetical protein